MHICRLWRKGAKFQKDQYKLLWGVMITRYPLSTSNVRKWKSSQSRKNWQKLMKWLYQKHMHIFRLWRKYMQSFKMTGIKMVWGVVLTRYPLSIYWGWKRKVHYVEKSDKKWCNNYIHTTGTSSNHEENTCKVSKWSVKTVTEVVLTSGTHSIYWGRKMTKFTMWKMWQKIMQQINPNHMHILIPWRKHIQSFKTIGTQLMKNY